jgi:hypothetical protein
LNKKIENFVCIYLKQHTLLINGDLIFKKLYKELNYETKKATIIILGTLTLVILWLFIDEREKSRRKDILINNL